MNTYFDYTNESVAYAFYRNTARSVHMTDYKSNSIAVGVEDASGQNIIRFYMYHTPTSAKSRQAICELCRFIAYSARGSVRSILENDRVLFLMKECGLTEIIHQTYVDGKEGYGTIWTPEDAEAMFG